MNSTQQIMTLILTLLLLPIGSTTLSARGAAEQVRQRLSEVEDTDVDPVVIDEEASHESIATLIADDESFSIVEAALQETGLMAALGSSSSSYTLFAPTDEALSGLPEETLDELIAHPDRLEEVLLYHIMEQVMLTEQLRDLIYGVSLSGYPVLFELTDEDAFANGIRISAPNLETGNGIVHAIDSVLFPPEQSIAEYAGERDDLSLLSEGLEIAGYTEPLGAEGPFTLLAPINDAFEGVGEDTLSELLRSPNELAQILALHLLEGWFFSRGLTELGRIAPSPGTLLQFDPNETGIVVNEHASIIEADIILRNGVIHLIDEVLRP